VDGTLPPAVIGSALPPNDYQRHGITALYLAAQLQVAKAGPVIFRLTGAPGALVWIDGKPQKQSGTLAVELASGSHTVTVRVDPMKLPTGLRLESSTGTFATD
jgi:hypothetical protein